MTDTLDAGSAVDATPAPMGEPVVAEAADSAPPSTATTAEGAAAEAAGATAEQVAELEARLNGQPYKLPAGVEIPWKRGNEQGYATLEEIQKAHMFERDYRVKTQQLAEQRNAFHAERTEFEKLRRQMEVERQFVQRENQLALEARTSGDPEKLAQYERHVELLATDERYREAYQKSLKADAYEAVQGYEQEVEQQQQATAILEDIQTTAARLAEEFPGVDVQRALARYGRALEEGRATLKESALRAVFQDEHAYVQRSVSPLAAKLEALEAELASLKSGTKADQHNDKIRSTIAKQTAARAVAATGASAPPNPSAVGAKPGRSRDRAAASQEWARAG